MFMPRTRMDELYALAEEHDGLLASKDARALGIQDSVLVRLAQRGRLERMSRGVYRMRTFRQTGLPSTAKRSCGHRQVKGQSVLPCLTKRPCYSTAFRT